jgi:ligand-binding sensor domain-containing protein
VNCIVEDRSGNIWFATHHRGVCRYDGKTFVNVSERNGMNGTEAWDVYQDNDGNIWFPLENDALYRYDGKTYTPFRAEQGIHSGAIQCVFHGKDGRIWAGGYLGLYRLDGDSFVKVGQNGPW